MTRPLCLSIAAAASGLMALTRCGPVETETALDVAELASTGEGSAYGPHAPRRGPWFEGWYTRITDAGSGTSVAVIVGSHVPRGETPAVGGPLPGYLGVLLRASEAAPTESYAFYPERARVEDQGEGEDSEARFTWSAEGLGRVTESTIDLEAPGILRVAAAFGARRPWDPDSPQNGPEGALGALPTPLHWYVHSLGSPASFVVERAVDGAWTRVDGLGFAHLEKNWGGHFPSAWVWSQAVSDDGRSVLVMSGGRLDGSLGRFEPWLVGFRTEDLSWNFSVAAPGTRMTRTISACTGELEVTLRDAVRTLVVEARAPIDDFAPVAIPTPDGFAEGRASESFSTEITVSAYQRDLSSILLGADRLVARSSFHGAALEFGADFSCAEDP